MNQKTVIITGGTKGIGRALVFKFASEGFYIFTCSRTKEDLEALKIEVENLFPNSTVDIFKADFSKHNEVADFVSFVKSKSMDIDVLINNTGVFIPGEIRNEEEGALELMMNTNMYSAYHLTRGFVQNMMDRKSGYIFNMCSVASVVAYPNGGSYSISKFALYGFTKVLREELKEHNVRVSAILPGATLTASWDGVDLPPDRFMKAEDVSDAVWSAYSLSPNSVVEEITIRPQLGDL